MTKDDFKVAYRELDRSQKRSFLFSVALAFLSTLFFAVGLLPPKAKVEAVSYQVSALEPPQAQPGQSQGILSNFVASNITLDIDKRFRGQRIHFKKVIFYDEKGKELATAQVASFSKLVQLRDEDSAQGPDRPAFKSPTPIEGALHLWPMESSQISLSVLSKRNPGVKPGQKIYAELKGRVGIRPFKVRTPVQPASGLGL